MDITSVGDFKIERELGRGGMGEVDLATDTRLDRQVAIKALPAHLA
jgi:serine/threonine protein kinase